MIYNPKLHLNKNILSKIKNHNYVGIIKQIKFIVTELINYNIIIHSYHV